MVGCKIRNATDYRIALLVLQWYGGFSIPNRILAANMV